MIGNFIRVFEQMVFLDQLDGGFGSHARDGIAAKRRDVQALKSIDHLPEPHVCVLLLCYTF